MQPHIKLEVNIEEINLIFMALGNLPYIQVHELIHKLQSQTGPQLVEQSVIKEKAK